MQFIACNIRCEAIRFYLSAVCFRSLVLALTTSRMPLPACSFFHFFFTSFISIQLCMFSTYIFILLKSVLVKRELVFYFLAIFVFPFSLVSFYYSLLERAHRALDPNVLVCCVAVSQHLIAPPKCIHFLQHLYDGCFFPFDTHSQTYSQTQTQTQTHSKKHGT